MRSFPVFFAVVALTLSGCQSKITKANYDKIVEGMSLKEVEKILGEGKQLGDGSGVAAQFGVNVPPAGGGGAEGFVWESDTAKITIHFVNGGVKTKTERGLK